MASNASPLEAIHHIVVLMLAGRSFDHMLGFLYPGNVSPAGQPFDGLTGTESNLGSDGQPVTVFRIEPDTPNAYRLPGASPGQGYQATNSQLYGSVTGPSSRRQLAQGQGFVANYADALRVSEQAGLPLVPGTAEGDIMGCFTPEALPVLSGLARGYAVCDRWFSAVPGGARANRAFAFAATSQGFLDNAPHAFSARSIFGVLDRHSVSWKMYGYDAPPLTKDMFNELSNAAAFHFGQFSDFRGDAAAGTLPWVTVLEPSWGEAGNSQQPPGDVALGEQLIGDVYTALRTGPNWPSTLLVITYDQHGGLFDHVSPPRGAVPSDNDVGEFGFSFDRFGVRVPAVLVSPLIATGTIYRAPAGSMPLDHTSILKTIEQRWGQRPLTRRDAAAPGFGDVLTLATPRTDDVLAGVTPPITLKPGSGAPLITPETAADGPLTSPGTGRPSSTLGRHLDQAHVSDIAQRTTLGKGKGGDDPLATEAKGARAGIVPTGSVPGRIFMSYRREDTAYPAAWLFDRLASHFGRDQVFKDVDSIKLGDDFVEVITAAVGSCEVLLALIGNRWLTIADRDGRPRLENHGDFVRLEIEAALARNVRVIPILADSARMPSAEELPASLAKLAHRQALELSPIRFDADTQRLLRVLDQVVAEAQEQEADRVARDTARQELERLREQSRERPLRRSGPPP